MIGWGRALRDSGGAEGVVRSGCAGSVNWKHYFVVVAKKFLDTLPFRWSKAARRFRVTPVEAVLLQLNIKDLDQIPSS